MTFQCVAGRGSGRAVVAFALGLVAVLAVSSAILAQVVRTGDPATRGLTDADFPRIQELAGGVYSYEQLRSAGDERFTTVSLFVVTSEGVLVADGQGSVTETQRMIDEIAKVTSQPITHVVVCSDHGDHTAGNSAFPAGATFYAHPTSRALLEAGAARAGRQGGAARGRGRGNAAPVRVPTEDVGDRLTIILGGKEIQLVFLGRAHTGGDLSVYLPEDKVLFMSEAYLNRIFPATRSAFPSEWVDVLKKAEAMDVDWYIPGHGFVESPEILAEELVTYRQALERVISEATRLHSAGVSLDDALEQAQFGDLETWTLRSSQAATAIRRVYLELNGGLPGGE